MSRIGRKLRPLLRCLWLGCALFGSTLLHADERILAYHSDIRIAADGSMLVTETIRVRAEGVDIRRGLYRAFPTRYRDRLGNAYRVDFEVLQLTRDGQPEPWEAFERANGVRVDFGDDSFLRVPAEYEYALRYRTTRQLGFFPDHDELYWNVTGNGWDFAIDEASATVTLPVAVAAADLALEGYTGATGARGQAYTVDVANGQATIRTTAPLRVNQGLTLVLSWPRGLIAEPTRMQRANYVVKDNRSLLLALVTLVASGSILLAAWSRVGRDPAPGVLFPHYAPPEGFSPATARYVARMGYDSKALTAALINLAVQGHLHIDQQREKYVLQRRASQRALAADEKLLLEKLFAGGAVLELDNKNHAIIGAAKSAHAGALKQVGLGQYFLNNSRYLLPSLLGSIAMFVLTLVLGGVVPLAVAIFILVLILHAVFGFLLKAPTAEGRQVMDKLDGFKLYLNVAEKDEMNLSNPPQVTPELFERFLPFAIALGVEQRGAERFERALAALQDNQGTAAYYPLWYAGHSNAANMRDFTRDVSSGFNSAISSAATPPGTASGGGSGGFSGGGGGGGGGGGR